MAMMNGWGGMGGGGWLVVLLLIVVVAAVIVGIVFLVRGLGGGVTAGGGTQPKAGLRESPQDILKRRYAAGEIDREEYEKALSDLRS
jgi:putative membrane protein